MILLATAVVMGRIKKGTGGCLSPAKAKCQYRMIESFSFCWPIHTAYHQTEDQIWHQTALAIVQKILVPQPRLCLAANLALHALFPFLRHKATSFREVLAQIIRHVTAFSQDNGLCALTRRRDDHDRGFSERMHLFQFRRRKHGLLVAVVQLNVKVDLEFFQEPYYALRARLVEPGEVSVSFG